MVCCKAHNEKFFQHFHECLLYGFLIRPILKTLSRIYSMTTERDLQNFMLSLNPIKRILKYNCISYITEICIGGNFISNTQLTLTLDLYIVIFDFQEYLHSRFRAWHKLTTFGI